MLHHVITYVTPCYTKGNLMVALCNAAVHSSPPFLLLILPTLLYPPCFRSEMLSRLAVVQKLSRLAVVSDLHAAQFVAKLQNWDSSWNPACLEP